MNETFLTLRDHFLGDRGPGYFRAVVLLFIGFFAARLIGTLTTRMLRHRMGQQGTVLARRLISNGLLVLFLIAALREAGFDLSVFLGAAGVLTVALGFASQTSVSNLISGMFLIGERAFEVGETVSIGTVTGEVLAVDWMSVKLRTFDNLMVRLPNETVLKAQITNLSRFPIRRLDQLIGVGYGSDLDQVREVLMRVANDNPLCLDEPKPILFHKGFGDSAIQLQFSVWFLTPNVLEVKNNLPQQIASTFAQAGIEIPFPQRTVTFESSDRAPTLVAVEERGVENA